MVMSVHPPNGLQTTAEFRRLVDEVQTLYNADYLPDEATLGQIAQKYVQAVEYANGRLEECMESLRKGLVDEAIQFGEIEPNLLQVATLLDFAERIHLGTFFQQAGHPAPPELKVDSASELNEAYVSAESLAGLMLKHRLHALARSPLWVRIDLMRKIAEKDAGNPIWEQDLRTYETARLQQVPGEFQKAIRSNDDETLTRLERELGASDWYIPPPKAIVNQVREAADQMRIKQARRDLRRIAEEFVAAHVQQDLAGGRAARERWNTLLAAAKLAQDDQLVTSVLNPLKWLNQEDQREVQEREQKKREQEYVAKLAEIQKAVDKKAGRTELQRLCKALEHFQREIPPDLLASLARRKQEIEGEERHRARRRVLKLAVVFLLVCAASISAVYLWQRADNFNNAKAQAISLLEAKEFDALHQWLAELEQNSPSIFHSPEIQQILADCQEALDQEAGRKERLEKLLSTVRDLGVENATLDTIPDAAAKLREAIDSELVITQTEQAEVSELAQQINERKSQLEQQVREKFLADFSDLQKRQAKITPEDDEKLGQLSNELLKLLDQKHVPDTEKYKAAQLSKELAQQADRMRLRRDEEKKLAQITGALGDYEKFHAQLTEYTQDPKFSGSARAGAFQTVLAEDGTLWDAIPRWISFQNSWSGKDFTRFEKQEKEKFLESAKAVFKDGGNLPVSSTVNDLLNFGPRQDAKPAILSTLQNPKIEQWQRIETTLDDKPNGPPANYYFDQQCRKPFVLVGTPKWQIEALLSTGESPGKSIKVISVIHNNRLSDGRYDWTSPQARFSNKAQQLLTSAGTGNWELVVLDVLSELHNETKQIDPILKLTLQRGLLNAAADSSLLLAQELQQQLKLLQQANLDLAVNWVDPDDKAAPAVRTACEKVLVALSKLDDPAKYKSRVEQKLAKLTHLDLGKSLEWVAWQCRDSSDQPAIRFKSPPSGTSSGELVVLSPAGAGQKVQIVKIGTVSGGVVSWAAGADSVSVEGRPVYLRQP